MEASSDGGASWTTVAYEDGTDLSEVDVGTPVCGAGHDAWLAGSRPAADRGDAIAPEILFTPDAGATWIDQSGNVEGEVAGASLAAGSFADARVGWLVGARDRGREMTEPVVLHTTAAARAGGSRRRPSRAGA